jgi:RNA polymerase sigma factor (sigma-70 family)
VNRPVAKVGPEQDCSVRDATGFTEFLAEAEPRLRRALTAALGTERGRDATAEALAYGWEHWEELRSYSNPVGYLYRVGRSRTRGRQVRAVFERPTADDPWVEPSLVGAVAALPTRQRVAVMLVFAAQWTPTEVAEILGVSPSTVRRHAERGLASLRSAIGTAAGEGDAAPDAAEGGRR